MILLSFHDSLISSAHHYADIVLNPEFALLMFIGISGALAYHYHENNSGGLFMGALATILISAASVVMGIRTMALTLESGFIETNFQLGLSALIGGVVILFGGLFVYRDHLQADNMSA